MQTAAERRERRAATCVHFTGIQNNKCAKGHAYTNPLPCLPPFQPHQVRGECVDCRLPTPEEMDAEDVRREESFKQYALAHTAVAEHFNRTKQQAATIACPCCEGGKLTYRRAASNGHVHARCSTEGCVAWME